jgi:hypothetical protein
MKLEFSCSEVFVEMHDFLGSEGLWERCAKLVFLGSSTSSGTYFVIDSVRKILDTLSYTDDSLYWQG